MQKGKDLAGFLQETTTADITRLLLSIADGTRTLSHAVRNLGVLNLGGSMDVTNIQGETVQKLDDFSNNVLMELCKASGVCAGYLSEENEDIVTLDPNGGYVVAIDPLDGSANIDIAAPVGTIFSIHERLSPVGGPVNHGDFLQHGHRVVAAGYALYGSSTILVFSTGAGTHMFSLDADDNHYYKSHTDVMIPGNGKIYSLNQGNLSKFEPVAQQFIEWCVSHDKETSRPYSLRYIGSMVGDMHRTFIKGGVFLYPAAKGEKRGKLRLLYECIPMAYITEQAGGKAINGAERILDIQPTELHERCAIIIGCKDMVGKYEEFAQAVAAV
ncbi:MAG: fructose-bisphosphatase [Bacteroidetes bacterium]|nr:fructose-bisphosphatase [Bacteroidota bacterium]